MEPWIQMLVTVFCAVLASSGFWAFMQKVCDKKDSKTKLLLGIAHNAIMEKGMHYLERGDWITQDEYENLHDYLYKPYSESGGNGSAKRVMLECEKLRVVPNTYSVKENKEDAAQ